MNSMSIFASVGHAAGGNPAAVGADAYQNALKGLGDQRPTLAFVFSSVAYEQETMLKGVQSVAGSVPIVGCSTAGEIVTDGPLETSSVAVMLLATTPESLTATIGIGNNAKNDERKAGQSAAQEVVNLVGGKEKLRGFIMLADGLAGNGAEIVRGVLDVLGDHFPVVGGSAGDDFKFKQTYQYGKGSVHTGDVIGVGLSGDFAFGIGVKHGWGVLGVPSRVTRSNGHIVHEIDGKPAMQLYEKYFGDRAKSIKEEVLATLAVSYPLGVKTPGSEEDYLIRDPMFVDENGSITCAAEIPEGSEVRIMMGTRESAITMATQAAENARIQLGGKTPKAILIFNCIARKKLLGMRGGEEIDAIRSILGRDVPLIGFYTYGEQAPINGESRNIERCNTVFHNETVVIYVIAE
jgi:hypothetical protein